MEQGTYQAQAPNAEPTKQEKHGTPVSLSCGFEAEIDETKIQEMEFLDALTEMQDGDPTGMSRMCAMLMSKADKKRLYDAVREKSGRATIETVGAQLTELLEQLKSKKK